MRDFLVGKEAHAAACPWVAKNALDAAVQCYSNISMIRQQMLPTCRVHGVITDGGLKPNIIPQRAELLYYVRAPSQKLREELKERIVACINAAAIATGKCKYSALELGNCEAQNIIATLSFQSQRQEIMGTPHKSPYLFIEVSFKNWKWLFSFISIRRCPSNNSTLLHVAISFRLSWSSSYLKISC